MAAPKNHSNPANAPTVVFDAEGNKFELARMNAIELVRNGTYFWRAEDANVERLEEDGPEDPTADEVTIFNAEGEPFTVQRANARELVNNGYFWNKPGEEGEGAPEAPAAEDETTPAPAADEEPAAIVVDPDEEIDPKTESLEDQALRVTGADDVIAYLEGFSLEALKLMAEERYGEKIHHRAQQDTAIQKIVEWEEARLVGDDQADA